MKKLCVALLAMGVAGPVWGTHNHPFKAKLLKVSFVTAYNECTAPTITHDPLLAVPACVPAPSTDNNPTSSVKFGPAGSMTAKIKVGNGDFKIKVKGTGIESNAVPFSGNLALSVLLRMSDHGCTGAVPCTSVDFVIPVPVQCSNGDCEANTTLNAVIPAFAAGGALNLEIGQMEISDDDTDAAFRQGLFLP